MWKKHDPMVVNFDFYDIPGKFVAMYKVEISFGFPCQINASRSLKKQWWQHNLKAIWICMHGLHVWKALGACNSTNVLTWKIATGKCRNMVGITMLSTMCSHGSLPQGNAETWWESQCLAQCAHMEACHKKMQKHAVNHNAYLFFYASILHVGLSALVVPWFSWSLVLIVLGLLGLLGLVLVGQLAQ